MSVAEQRPSPPTSAERSRVSLSGRLPASPAWLWIAVLVAASVAVYTVLALLHPVPVVYPDESLYGELAASIAHGDGQSWRGQPVDLRAALYVYAISPAWMVAGGHAAYTLAKLIGVVAISATAIPVWLVLRRVAAPRVALAAAVLTLSGTWMVQAAALVTETLSLPLATASLCATVAATRKPGSRYAWIALVFALLATAARIQCVVLVPAILASLLLDVTRSGRRWRARARAHAAPIIVMAGLALAGAVAYLTHGAALVGSGGGYDTVLGYHPTVGATLRLSGMQALALGVSTGMLPLAIVSGCMVRPAAWRDKAVGSMLVVALPVTVGACLQSGFFLAGIDRKFGGAGHIWTSQRYVVYAAPLILGTALLAGTRPRVLDRWALLVAAGSLLLLHGISEPGVLYEERAMFAVVAGVHHVLPGAGGGTSALLWAGATALLWAGLWYAGRRRRWSGPLARGLLVALGVGLLAQSAGAWHRDLATADRFRAGSPADLQWIDHHSTGPVGVLVFDDVGGELADMELLNSHVASVSVVKGAKFGWQLIGPLCQWDVASDGRLVFSHGCSRAPRELLIEDPRLHMTFYDERRSIADPHVGRLVTVAGAPRARALVRTPCERILRGFWVVGTMEAPEDWPCLDGVDLWLWSDAPGKVRLRFRGAPLEDHTATVGVDQHPLPAGRVTDVVLPVGRGEVHRPVVLDWTQPGPSSPVLLSVELIEGGRRFSLL